MKKKLTLSVCAVLAGLVGRANADVIATFTGVDSERDIHISINDTFSTPTISENEYVATGFYQWSGVDTNPTGLQGNFSTFCIDFTQDIDYNQPPYTYQLAALDGAPSDTPAYQDPLLSGSGMGTVRANAIRELWGLEYDSLDNPDEVAGFQLAIWKILYEPTITEIPTASLDVTTGNFKTTDSGAFVTYANEYLASIVSDGQYRTDHLATDLYALTNGSAQDQIVELPDGPSLHQQTPPVPLPSAAYGGMALLAGFGLLRARQRAALA